MMTEQLIDPAQAKAIEQFLVAYKALCDKWNCVVLSEGEQVEVVYCPEGPANCYDYWGVERTTRQNSLKHQTAE